jgi:mRNA-degrading endonuclease YafQ of YafQ-DinJ toxin-antitoxin module
MSESLMRDLGSPRRLLASVVDASHATSVAVVHDIAPDWVLIYRLDDDAVHLTRTGTHADLFE